MTFRVISTFLLMVLALESSRGQNWLVRSQIGIGSYNMTDLKNRQINYLNGTINNIQLFPDYPFYSLYFGRLIKQNVGVEIRYNFMSTGARSDYQDYSGLIRLDQRVKSSAIGINGSLKLLSKNQLSLWIDGAVLRANTKLTIEETRQILSVINSMNTANFESTSYLFEFGFRPSYQLKKFVLGATIGFNIDSKGNLEFNGTDPTDIASEWSGIRLGLIIALVL